MSSLCYIVQLLKSGPQLIWFVLFFIPVVVCVRACVRMCDVFFVCFFSSVFILLILVLTQGLSVYSCLAWNSLCKPDWL